MSSLKFKNFTTVFFDWPYQFMATIFHYFSMFFFASCKILRRFYGLLQKFGSPANVSGLEVCYIDMQGYVLCIQKSNGFIFHQPQAGYGPAPPPGFIILPPNGMYQQSSYTTPPQWDAPGSDRTTVYDNALPDLPAVPAGSVSYMKPGREDVNFDDLTKRFEDLKKKK